MKVKDLLKFTVKNLKPRDPNQMTLAAKKNAGGPMRDKRKELKSGNEKHKSSFFNDE